jgi:DNA-binding MarR family transcriptional regulator
MKTNKNISSLLQHVTSLLAKHLDQVLQEQLGIGLAQFRILQELQTSPQVKQKDIAFNLGQTEASISRQVKLMIKLGLLASSIDSENKRIHITMLTQKGTRLTEAAEGVIGKFSTPALSVLSSKQREQFTTALEIVHKHICYSSHPKHVNKTKKLRKIA